VTKWTEADTAEMRRVTEAIAWNAAHHREQDEAQLARYREMAERRARSVREYSASLKAS
jgi:hypothetical protein